ncbi:DUF4838 domain-containing protein [bacterium]|nr:DUF4838 domain-containing protein [bacterium]
MKQALVLLACLMTMACSSWAPATRKGASIVVNLGSFTSARQAVDARGDVDWSVAESPGTIVCTEALAALELQHYLAKMTGLPESAFPIIDDDQKVGGPTILVGNPRSNKQVANRTDGMDWAPGTSPQSYRIIGNPENKTIILLGNDRVGTLYAAYRYLDLLGVRWYGPGEVNEEVPHLAKFEIKKIDISEKPGFTVRGFWVWEDRGTPEFIEWMGRNRLNFWTVEQHDPANCKMRGLALTCGAHDTQSRFINPNAPYPYCVPQFPNTAGKPADPYPPGDYQGDLNGDQALSYREVHPEWYGMINGKRQLDMWTDFGTNICDSNPAAVRELNKNIVTALCETKWQMAESFNFWMMDGYNRWCECPQCKAMGLSLTDRNFRLLYALQQEIRKAQKEGRLKHEMTVNFLCYTELIQPPKAPLPADFDFAHCVATYFPISRCYVHAFDDPRCTEFNKQYFEAYQGWANNPNSQFKGPLYIGEYYNISRFHHLPLVLDEIMRADIPYYYKTGARSFNYMHAPTANWGTRTLTQWQMARMLWDPNLNVDELLDDYYAGRYGPAAGQMRKVYGSLRTAMSNAHVIRYPLRVALERGYKNLFNTKHMRYDVFHPATDDGPDWVEVMAAMKDARAQLEKAKQIKVPERIRARIAEDDGLITMAGEQTDLYDRAIAAQTALNKGDKAAARKALDEARPIAARLKADTRSVQFGSSHVNSPDALEATGIAGGLARMEKAAAE